MNTKEKTKRIMKLMGYKYRHDGITGEWWKGQELFYNEWFKDGDCVAVTTLDLYSTKNMALAWRVLGWAVENNQKCGFVFDDVFVMFSDDTFLANAEAQTLWLDKILELSQQASHL